MDSRVADHRESQKVRKLHSVQDYRSVASLCRRILPLLASI